MRQWKKFTQKLSKDTYRLRVVFFLLLGLVLILWAFLPGVTDPIQRDLLIQFAVVFIGVSLVQAIWDFVGGNPTEERILSKLDEIQQSVDVVNDLVNYHLGIEHIWPTRDIWQADQENGLEKWHQRVCQAEQVEIASATFWRNWMEKKEVFVNDFFQHIQHKNVKARILIYHPGAAILHLRAKHEKPNEVDPEQEMKAEITKSLQAIIELQNKLDENSKINIEIRLSTFYYHMAQIIRADDKMLVSNYLSSKSGHPIPTFQIVGQDTTFFKTYKDQFILLWNKAVPLSAAEMVLAAKYITLPLLQEDPCRQLICADSHPK